MNTPAPTATPEPAATPEPTATPAPAETPTPAAAPGTGPRRAARNVPTLKVTALPTAAGITYRQTLEEATLDPIPLNITGIKVKSRKYDGTTRVPVESLILEGVLEADKDKVWANPDSLTATVASASAGTYDTVTLGPSMELDGSAKGNYTLPGIELTFTGAQVNGGKGVIIEPAPAPAPTPDDSVYYTCKACGYHNWTATEAGYRCDTCGYLESVKQLSGYRNVKGLYTPQTNTAAAAASRAGSTESMPQTGDEGDFLLWGCLLVLSSSALAAMEIRRKRN